MAANRYVDLIIAVRDVESADREVKQGRTGAKKKLKEAKAAMKKIEDEIDAEHAKFMAEDNSFGKGGKKTRKAKKRGSRTRRRV